MYSDRDTMNVVREELERDCCLGMDCMEPSTYGYIGKPELYGEDGLLCSGTCGRKILLGFVIAHRWSCPYKCPEELDFPKGSIMCLDCFEEHPRIRVTCTRNMADFASKDNMIYILFNYSPPGLNTKGAHNKP